MPLHGPELGCQAWFPGSFAGVELQRPRTWIELLFLSFSTLSGVGNGDILPLSAQARMLVMLEHGRSFTDFVNAVVPGRCAYPTAKLHLRP